MIMMPLAVSITEGVAFGVAVVRRAEAGRGPRPRGPRACSMSFAATVSSSRYAFLR